MLSHVRLFVTPWTVACWAPLSMRFFRKEYWSGLPLPSPGVLPNPGIEPSSPELQAGSLPLSYLGSPSSAYVYSILFIHPSINGHLGCLRLLAAVNMPVGAPASVPLGKNLGGGVARSPLHLYLMNE